LPSSQKGESFAGALFGGKTFRGCTDDDAVEADSMHADDEGTLDNSFSLPRSKVRDRIS
jgi:hypothetical protein